PTRFVQLPPPGSIISSGPIHWYFTTWKLLKVSSFPEISGYCFHRHALAEKTSIVELLMVVPRSDQKSPNDIKNFKAQIHEVYAIRGSKEDSSSGTG
ncbi:hypothetical protein FRC01_014515, partial [Tulasnella sp. 417]